MFGSHFYFTPTSKKILGPWLLYRNVSDVDHFNSKSVWKWQPQPDLQICTAWSTKKTVVRSTGCTAPAECSSKLGCTFLFYLPVLMNKRLKHTLTHLIRANQASWGSLVYQTTFDADAEENLFHSILKCCRNKHRKGCHLATVVHMCVFEWDGRRMNIIFLGYCRSFPQSFSSHVVHSSCHHGCGATSVAPSATKNHKHSLKWRAL